MLEITSELILGKKLRGGGGLGALKIKKFLNFLETISNSEIFLQLVPVSKVPEFFGVDNSFSFQDFSSAIQYQTQRKSNASCTVLFMILVLISLHNTVTITFTKGLKSTKVEKYRLKLL